jgi:hypothetical protein
LSNKSELGRDELITFRPFFKPKRERIPRGLLRGASMIKKVSCYIQKRNLRMSACGIRIGPKNIFVLGRHYVFLSF